jgi:phasin
MAELPKFEIPDAVREVAERNVEQARAAYSQFLDMARQAQDVVAKSSDVMAESAREIQLRAMRFAQDNLESSFNFASELASARDLKEYLDIQTRFAQQQMKTYATQAQDLGQLVGDAAQKAQPKS